MVVFWNAKVHYNFQCGLYRNIDAEIITDAVNTVKTNVTSSPLLTRASRSSLLLLLSADHEKWYVPRILIPMRRK